MKQDKPYKALYPLNTINNIRNILAECGIFLIENSSTDDYNFFSCRLIICNHGIFKLGKGTNGKALTPEFSLASAYGEFMERIQNYQLFVEAIGYAKNESINRQNNTDFSKKIVHEDLVIDFIFDPDEKYLSYNELSQNQKNIFNHIALFNESVELAIKEKKDNKMLLAPFYCIQERCTEFLPIRLLQTGSNGMCAGNLST